jgi:hypothetical protein
MRGLSEDLNIKNKINWQRRRDEVNGNKEEVKRGREILGRRGFEEQKT